MLPEGVTIKRIRELDEQELDRYLAIDAEAHLSDPVNFGEAYFNGYDVPTYIYGQKLVFQHKLEIDGTFVAVKQVGDKEEVIGHLLFWGPGSSPEPPADNSKKHPLAVENVKKSGPNFTAAVNKVWPLEARTNVLRIRDMAVLAKYRRQGIATELLKAVAKEADSLGLPLAVYTHKEQNLAVYAKVGLLPMDGSPVHWELVDSRDASARLTWILHRPAKNEA